MKSNKWLPWIISEIILVINPNPKTEIKTELDIQTLTWKILQKIQVDSTDSKILSFV